MSEREDDIREAREQLMSRGLVESVVPDRLVADEIEQSWRRSVSNRVDPAASALHVLREIDPDSSILRAAGRVLDQWQTNLSDSRLTLFLADDSGRIVSRRTVDARDGKILDRASAVEGSDFSEQSLGTNGLGTPIEAGSVVFVRGSEHFNDALARVACAGVPIKHPITGRVVGSLAIASGLDVANPLMVSMVRQAGTQIAEELELMTDSRDLELAKAYRRLRSSRGQVLAMNSETVMTDIPSLAYLDAETHADLWEKLRRHHWDGDSIRLDLPAFGTAAEVHRLGRSDRDDIYTLRFIGPFVSGEATQSSRDSEGVANQGNAVPLPAIRDQFDRAAGMAGRGIVRVVGRAGTGKCYESVRWLREGLGADPVVVDLRAAGCGADTALTKAESALRDGHSIVIRGGEMLVDDQCDRLAELAGRFSPQGSSPTTVIVTERCVTPESEVRSSPAVVGIPSLAERRDELPAIIREVDAGVRSGGLPIRFSSAALQALLAWRWPGNIAELVEVIGALPHRDRLIEAKDLPAEMLAVQRSTLSRYEQVERDEIERVLWEMDGNKSRAAEALGIGRTTLYRKMRVLKIGDRDRMTSA